MPHPPSLQREDRIRERKGGGIVAGLCEGGGHWEISGNNRQCEGGDTGR